DVSNYGEYQLQIRDGDIISPRIEASEPLKNQCTHFLECVAQGIRPLTDGWGGHAVVEVMEAIDRSLERNGAPVEVEHCHDGVAYAAPGDVGVGTNGVTNGAAHSHNGAANGA